MEISPTRTLIPLVAALAVLLLGASPGHAIDSCKVKVDKKTGVIQVDASGVGGPLTWGSQSGSETNAFFNAGSCVVGDKAKRCQLADPLTLASKTAPEGCTLYLADTMLSCSAWIPGCSPGSRHDSSVVMKDASGVFVGNASNQYGTNVTRDVGGYAVNLTILFDGSGFEQTGYLYYLSNNCSGSPLMLVQSAMILQSTIFGTNAYIPPQTGSIQNAASYLAVLTGTTSQGNCDAYYGPGSTFVAPTGCCFPTAFPQNLGAASTLDLTPFLPPFKAVAN